MISPETVEHDHLDSEHQPGIRTPLDEVPISQYVEEAEAIPPPAGRFICLFRRRDPMKTS